MSCSTRFSSLSEPSPLLEARHISRDFNTRTSHVRALASISLTIMGGEFIVIRGPSGSGKSTLLSLLAGMDFPTTGTVLFQGITMENLDPSALAKLRNRHFGFIFQSAHMLYDRTVIENVALPAQYNLDMTAAQATARANELLDYVDLRPLAKRRPQTLSGGELQRVAFARALLCNPDLIFADEPTGSLDAENSRIILELLQKQCEQQRTVVMVTHDENAMSYGSKIVHLSKFSVEDDAAP